MLFPFLQVEGFTGHKIPKGIVQNTLEELSKSGELTCKEGKAGKVYWFTQTQFKTKGLVSLMRWRRSNPVLLTPFS